MNRLTIVKLQREGTLAAGDTVRTTRRGECRVTAVLEPDANGGRLLVERFADGTSWTVSGINFGPGVSYNERDVVQP